MQSMASSLEKLAVYLPRAQIQIMKQLAILTKNSWGCYCVRVFIHTNTLTAGNVLRKEKYLGSRLPTCTDSVKRIWYQDIEEYLKLEVLLPADVFVNFRTLCSQIYVHDTAQYITAPRLALDAMLEHTGVNLEDVVDMHWTVEAVLRGGSVCCKSEWAILSTTIRSN